MKAKLLAVIRAILIALVILSGTIAVPILCRPFYYQHIAPFDLPEITGMTVHQIKTAYNEVLDFCIGISDTFSAGVLSFSESGVSHFDDVKKLFILDLRVLSVAIILLIVAFLIPAKRPARLLGHTPGFWSAACLGGMMLAVGALAASNLDKAFVVFHKLLFPGKTNWLFSSVSDPIITLLPVEFFRNCGILILTLTLLCCIALVAWDSWLRHRK